MSSQNPSAMSSEQNSSASSNDATASSGSHDASLVRSAQQARKDKGYDTGAIDGQMGPATQGALRSFQQAQGLPQSGHLDQQTLAALGVEGRGAASSSGASASPSTSSSTGSSAMSQGSTSSPQASSAAK
jgi:peptidoglycan hydrolase-like protein with peptidoglycan-binding domain